MNPDKNKYIWATLMAISLLIILLPISSYIAAISHIKNEWDLNNSEVALIYSSYLIGYAISALIIVPVTNKSSCKTVLIISSIISVITHILFSIISEDLISGSIIRFFSGAGYVGIYIAGLRIISEQFSDNNRGKAIGLFVTAQYLSHSLSLGVTDVLINGLSDWRYGYSIISIISSGGIILFFLLTLKIKQASLAKVDDSSSNITKDKNIVKIIISYSIHALVLYSIRIWSPIFLNTSFATSSSDISSKISGNSVAAIAFAIAAIGPFIGGIFSDRVGVKKSISVIVSICAISGILFGFVELLDIMPLLIFLLVIYAFSASSDSSIYQIGLFNTANSNNLGKSLGIQSFAGLMGGCIGPIIIGFVTDVTTDNYQWIISFTILGFLSILSLININSLTLSRKSDQSDL